MKIVLESEEAILLEPTDGPLTIEASSAEMSYSPFHMLASSLATCTFSVLYSWAIHADLSINDLTVRVSWTFADEPHRVGNLQMVLNWPSLPQARAPAATRAAALCAIHATLSVPPQIDIQLGS